MMNHSTRRRKRQRRSHSRRRGSVLVIVGIGMVALLGFCALGVDYSILVSTRNHLQRACDAAALAGAAELPASDSQRQGYARSKAELTAFNNGVATSEITVSFPAYNRIQVSARRTVGSLFAKAIGVMSRDVAAQALAGRSALKGITGAVPLAITVDDYNTHKDGGAFEEELIDNNRQDFRNTTVTALDLRLVGSSRVDLQACKLEYSIVSPK